MHVRAWRNFKRMQASTCAFAFLVYLAAVVHAWRVLPGPENLKLIVTLGFPAFYFAAALVLPLQIRPVRRLLKHYVWISFAKGFGQTAASVIVPLSLIGLAAAMMYLEVSGAAKGGPYPAGVFSAYGAGVGIVFAQALLAFALEREPKIREIIEKDV
jgi:hypothetical protein